MTHAQLARSNACAAPPREVITAIENLYIVSSALAQRGMYAQEIRDSQWRTIVHRIHEAKAALDQLGPETHATVLLRRMTKVCESLIDLHAAHREIPFAVWREVGRAGHDAYDWINLIAPRRRVADA